MTPEEWQRLKVIFHAALEMPEDERVGFVRERCGDDAALCEEIEILLATQRESVDFIESPALKSITSFVSEAPTASYPGKQIGKYQIEQQIGRGGMGAVYLAHRADREFDKKVAVKLIKRGLDTEAVISRFRTERQILANLDHPFITKLLDGGTTDDGLPYLVMDHVEGRPLHVYCSENRLSVDERLTLFLKVCSAVAYAHQNLVVHRDLKPSNILVTKDGVPKLLDFGIAKLLEDEIEPQTPETRIAFQALTPDYASPEQLAGNPVTTSSDIYSLGVVLYELLTGHRPFRFKTKDIEEISRVHIDTSPTRPSQVCRELGVNISVDQPETVSRRLRGDLDNIILMAMRKEPERRYSSVEQFANDIQRHLSGMPVNARDDTFGYRASKFVGRNKAGVAAGIGIAATLVGGLIAVSRQARIASRQRDRALREEQKARKVNEFLQQMLASADPRKAGKDLRVADMLRLAAESVRKEFALEPEIAGDLNTTIGLTYLSLGQMREADLYLRSALDIRLASYPRISVEVATSLNNYAKLLEVKGDLDAAEKLYREALATLSVQCGRRDQKIADVLKNLGYLTALKGNSSEAIKLHREEIEIRREIQGESHPDFAMAISKLADVYTVTGRPDLSEPLHRRALEIFRSNYGDEHPDIASTMSNLIRDVLPTRPDEAEQLSREALAMRRRSLGEDHPDVVWSLYSLAYVLIARDKFDEAEQILNEALSKRGANLPDGHPVVASCFLLLGRSLMARRSFNEAHTAFEKCLDLRLKTLPADHWLLATTRTFLGECLVYLGDAEIGEKMLLENYRALREMLGDEHDQTRQAGGRILKIISGNREV